MTLDQDTLVNGLAVIGAVTLLYAVVRVLAAIASWAQSMPDPGAGEDRPPAARAGAPRPVPASMPALDADIVVIAAAVAATLGAGRIVHIEDPNTGHAWSAEGRWLHQTSHRPH
ncbi:hypothetical protein GALL_196420 [mine drainage metagenome]|uniref:Oxaloacetate decarboxylase, gamma chain n=1 Tax=mine drainage metagenome TaxID=410659 RepID=A0A1J5S2A4_9ZZZZ